MVRLHIDGEYGGGGTAGEDVGRCPIESGMTGRVGQDVDEVGHDGERDEAGREDRRGFPIDVGDD